MAKMNYQKQNKFRNGSFDRRDENKSAGERWLDKHDPKVVKHKKKPQRKRKPE